MDKSYLLEFSPLNEPNLSADHSSPTSIGLLIGSLKRVGMIVDSSIYRMPNFLFPPPLGQPYPLCPPPVPPEEECAAWAVIDTKLCQNRLEGLRRRGRWSIGHVCGGEVKKYRREGKYRTWNCRHVIRSSIYNQYKSSKAIV